jgi:hypothetical protein
MRTLGNPENLCLAPKQMLQAAGGGERTAGANNQTEDVNIYCELRSQQAHLIPHKHRGILAGQGL